MASKAGAAPGGAGAISADDLTALGNAEDYLRVASNICTVYENVLALSRGVPVKHVFSFASATMPVIAVVLTRGGGPVHLYHGDAAAPFDAAGVARLATLGGDLRCVAGAPPATHPGGTVLALEACGPDACARADAVVGEGALFINDPTKVSPATILTIRKRMACPITTPAAEAALQAFCGQASTADSEEAGVAEVAAYHAHLQTMSGTPVDTGADPVTCQAGLPTIATLWLTLEDTGGANVVMCSTAYGGSSELTDICMARGGKITKSTYDIQGDVPMEPSIEAALASLQADPSKLLPTTVRRRFVFASGSCYLMSLHKIILWEHAAPFSPPPLPPTHTLFPLSAFHRETWAGAVQVLFVEVPSNPDQKIPDLARIARALAAHEQASGKRVLVLIDTTFAPSAQVLAKVREGSPDLPAMVFLSMSKSVSRGLTTAGGLVANHTAGARDLVNASRQTAAFLDVTARRDQLLRLCRNHEGVEDRLEQAYVGCTLNTPRAHVFFIS